MTIGKNICIYIDKGNLTFNGKEERRVANPSPPDRAGTCAQLYANVRAHTHCVCIFGYI